MAVSIYIRKRFSACTSTDAHIAAALKAYADVRGLSCGNCIVHRTARGKPYVDCADVHIGVSHTQTHVFVAVGNRPFGIDAEPIGRTSPRQRDICRRFFSQEEQRLLADTADFAADFLWLWVKKEAFLKYRGTGLGELQQADTTRLPGRFYTFCAAGHQIAVYAEADLGKIEIEAMDDNACLCF